MLDLNAGSEMAAYQARIIDKTLDDLFPHFAAVSIEGARAVGKTSTGRQRAQSVIDLDLPEVRALIEADPLYISRAQSPILIDEWQMLPEVWDRVRRLVDEDSTGGRFILTGSAAPRGARIHSGAGRIQGFRMRPLSIAERALETPTVRVADLLAGNSTPIQGESGVDLLSYVHEIVASGFPQARVLPARARQVWLDNYIDRVVTHDFLEQGQAIRQPEVLIGWLRGYAKATAKSTTWAKISANVDPGARAVPAASTALRYRDILSSLFLLDQVDAWIPGQRLVSRPSASPKHFMVDPALAVRLQGLDETKLLSTTEPATNSADRTRLGAFFEALVALSLQTYAAANDARLSHFRDRDGAREVDFIVHRADSSAVAVEVKLKATVDDDDVRHLLWLKEALPETIVDLVVITTGAHAYRRTDGVAVVPLALLAA